MPDDLTQASDSQDLAEVFDETNLTEDGEDIADPDAAPALLDVTTLPGDSAADEAEEMDLAEDASPGVEHDPKVDRHLDEGLEETFPASDPVSINPHVD